MAEGTAKDSGRDGGTSSYLVYVGNEIEGGKGRGLGDERKHMG